MVILCPAELRKYERMTRHIAAKYVSRLNHRFLIQGIFLNTTVRLLPHPCGSKEGSDGQCQVRFTDHNVTVTLLIRVNPAESDRKIAGIIAHEMAHALIDTNGNFLTIGALTKDGSEFSHSSLVRISPEGENYGTALNEAAAERIARYIISHCRYSDRGENYSKSVREGYDILCRLIDRMASAFGEPLSGAAYIDEFTHSRIEVPPEHPLFEKLGEDEYDRENDRFFRAFDWGTVRNSFWYHAATNTFHCIINDYEAVMGSGSYRELCRDLDLIYERRTGYWTPAPEDIAASDAAVRRAEEKLDEFCRKSGEEEAEPDEFYPEAREYIREHHPELLNFPE